MFDDESHPFPLSRPIQVARDERSFRYGIKGLAVSAKSMVDTMVREIDTRPADPGDAEDWNWGEQDSLANIPRKTMPTWVRAAQQCDPNDQGDEY